MKEYLIIANGPFLPREMIQEAAQHKIVLALDGAADRLANIGILPQIILGDFDSINHSHWNIKHASQLTSSERTAYVTPDKITMVLHLNQDLTDLYKAIDYCDDHEARTITLICATGGRMDHHEAALRALRVKHRPDRSLSIHTESQTLRYAADEEVVIHGQPGDPCGIFAYPQGRLTTQGLRYDVSDYPLLFGHSESIANSLIDSQATVMIKGGALIIMPPQLEWQRKFAQLSDRERLGLLLRDTIG